jgi:hypothetical protein
MAKVKIEEIIGHLSSEMKKAMAAAVLEVAPNQKIDSVALYRAFVRAVGRKCSTWETVPSNYVEE